MDMTRRVKGGEERRGHQKFQFTRLVSPDFGSGSAWGFNAGHTLSRDNILEARLCPQASRAKASSDEEECHGLFRGINILVLIGQKKLVLR